MIRSGRVRPRAQRIFALRAGLRAVAVFALVVLFAQYLLPGLHHTFEAHEVCPEHGELIHSVAAHGSEGSPAEGTEVCPGSAADEHGHCAIVPAVRTEGQAPAAPVELEIAPPSVRLAAISSAPPVVSSKTALFRLAPKQSPPA